MNIETIVDFGCYTALGVSYAFIVSMTLVPALYALLPRRAGAVPGVQQRWGAALRRLTEATLRHRHLVLLISALVTIGALALFPYIDQKAFVFDDLRAGTPLRREIDDADARAGGLLPFAVLLEGPEEALVEPAVVAIMGELRRTLRAIPGVEATQALDLAVRRANHVWHDEDPAMDKIPETREAVSQFLELIPADMSRDFLKKDMAVVLARTRDFGSIALRPILDAAEAAIERHRPDLKARGIQATLSGTTPLVQEVYDSILNSLWSSLLASTLLLSLLFWALYGSPRAAIIFLIPNILPLPLLAGALVILGIPLKPSTAMIFSVVFGIAVDDTIHFIARFRAERASGRPQAEALIRTLEQTGAAIIMTTAVLATGFGVLALSNFEGVAHLGLLFAVGLSQAVLGDLFLLPALLESLPTDFSRAAGEPS